VTLLPHEIAFGGYLAVMAVALLIAGGPAAPGALTFSALVAAGAVITAWAMRRPTDARWRWRLGFYAVAMNAAFMQMRTSVPFLRTWRADEALQAADRVLFRGNVSLRLEPLIHPAVTELLSACYFLFFPYLLFSLVWALAGDVARCRRFFAGLFTIYGVGFLGYCLMPAAGPRTAMAGAFHVPLTGWAVTRLNDAVVTAGSNRVDVFPSLHAAVSAYILWFDRRHTPWRFRAYAVPCAGLWLATLWLRYHYATDLVAGFALTAVGARIAMKARAA